MLIHYQDICKNNNSGILNPIYYSVLILSTTFVIYPLWLNKFKNKTFVSVLWNIAVFYNLAFSSTLMVIIGQFDQMQLTVLMASLVVVGILMRWQVAMLIIIGGTIISIECYKIYADVNFLPQNMDSLQFKITYSMLLVTSMLIAFFKPKQEYEKLIQDKAAHLDLKIQDQEEMLEKALKLKYEFLANLEHEGNTPISTIVSMTELMESNYDKLSDDQMREGLSMVSKSSNRLLRLVNSLIDVSAQVTDLSIK
ncbi:MAG: sensor histidine kinase [Rickettsiaceae bacterium]